MKSTLFLLPILAFSVAALPAATMAQTPQVIIPPIPQLPQVPLMPKLKVGDAAPKLAVAKWVKGNPSPSLFGNGVVTVLDFWASWCPTCNETFDHVAELARKYKGKALFVGVSVWENPDQVKSGAYINNVRQFVAAKGDTMPYAVAVDDQNSTVAMTWLGENTGDIPKSFVIDRNGRIAWSGHPLADLDEVLPLVISGRFDMTRAVQRQDAQLAATQELITIVVPIQLAVQAKKFDEAVKAINIAIEKKPMLEAGFGPTKFQMLLRSNESGAYAYARDLANGVCKDSAMALNLMAWSIVDDEAGLKNPDVSTALILAKRAYELTNHEDAYITDTLAYALYKSGEKSKALELQLKAVRIAEATKDFDPKTLKELKERLASFRKNTVPPL